MWDHLSHAMTYIYICRLSNRKSKISKIKTEHRLIFFCKNLVENSTPVAYLGCFSVFVHLKMERKILSFVIMEPYPFKTRRDSQVLHSLSTQKTQRPYLFSDVIYFKGLGIGHYCLKYFAWGLRSTVSCYDDYAV